MWVHLQHVPRGPGPALLDALPVLRLLRSRRPAPAASLSNGLASLDRRPEDVSLLQKPWSHPLPSPAPVLLMLNERWNGRTEWNFPMIKVQRVSTPLDLAALSFLHSTMKNSLPQNIILLITFREINKSAIVGRTLHTKCSAKCLVARICMNFKAIQVFNYVPQGIICYIH